MTLEPWITSPPPGDEIKTGFIFYPGGLVPAEAYAPALREIAAAGHLVVAPSMPLNLAVLAPGSAEEIIESYPRIEHWAIGGHSLGGSMAIQFIRSTDKYVDGLVLWAAYPGEEVDIAAYDLHAVSIYGTRDGLVDQEEIDRSRRQLPAGTIFIPIEGGNHAQFGSYGAQEGR